MTEGVFFYPPLCGIGFDVELSNRPEVVRQFHRCLFTQYLHVSNQVVAYCGNVHFDRKQEGNQVDVIQAPRSTGSILKPFLYSAMLQEGSLLPQMLLPDVPVNINGFTPQNFSMQFEGAVPASEALARSLNIPAVTMLQRYGVPKFHHMLQQMGFKTINRSASHYGLKAYQQHHVRW